MKRHIPPTCGIVLLFLFLFALRVVHPTADPPADLDWSGGIFFDEGMLVHGARNQVLFGRWDLDEWNDFYLSPILAYIKWGVLSLIGVGIAQERVIPLAFSFLTLIVFYWACKESFDRRTALLAVVLLGFDYVFIMFNRLGLTETSVVFFMVLTAYLWQRGFAGRPGPAGPSAGGDVPPAAGLRPAPLFLAGAACFTAYVFKSFPYFLPVPAVATLLSRRLLPRPPLGAGAAGARWRDLADDLKPVAYVALGMAAPFLVWYVFFYRPHARSIQRAMAYFQYQSVPATLQQLWINVFQPPFFDYFVQAPVVLLFSVLGVGYVIYLFFHATAELRPLDLFMLCWFLAHFVLYTVLNYRPVRYYVPVIPPMCALAARVMIAWGSLRALTIPARVSAASAPLLVAWLTVLLGYGVFPLTHRFVPSLPVPFRHATWGRRMLIALVVSGAMVGMAALICRLWRGRSWSVPRPLTATGFLALPLAAVVLVNGYQYARWAAHPRHVIRDVSRELGGTLDRALIAGLGAPMIVMENTHRALHVYPLFFNDRETLERYPVTHLFMGAFNQEVDFYYREFARRMRRATLLKVYPIKESHFYLYSLVEPSIEEIHVGGDSSPSDRQVRVTVAVENHEAAAPREVTAGWVLHPVDAPSGDITVTAPSPLRLGPGEVGAVNLSGEAAPGTYRLMAFTAPPYRNVFEAELLVHRLGERQKDPEASDGEAWRVRRADPHEGQAVFGPYLRYPPGRLKVAFRLKTADNRVPLPVALIDITAEGGRKILARRDVRGVDFTAPGAYEEFELSALLEAVQVLEFRVGSYKRADLWIDRIDVEFTPGEWFDRRITVGTPRL